MSIDTDTRPFYYVTAKFRTYVVGTTCSLDGSIKRTGYTLIPGELLEPIEVSELKAAVIDKYMVLLELTLRDYKRTLSMVFLTATGEVKLADKLAASKITPKT